MRNLIFGNTQFFVPHFADWTKDKFFSTYAPLGVHVEDAWQLIQESLQKLGLSQKFCEQVKSEVDVRKPNKKGK